MNSLLSIPGRWGDMRALWVEIFKCMEPLKLYNLFHDLVRYLLSITEPATSNSS